MLAPLRAFVPVFLVSLCGVAVLCALIASMPQGLRFTSGFAFAIAAGLMVAAAGLLLAKRGYVHLSAVALAGANIVFLKPFVELAHLAPAYLGRHLPFVDGLLARYDQSLGFDWTAYFMWHAAHPWFGAVCRAAYLAWPSIALVTVGVLAIYGQFERLARFLIATTLSLIAVDLVAIYTPSYGAYVQHAMSAAQHPGFFVQFANFKPAYDALRAGIVDIYAADIPAGAISFPSFHTTTVVLYLWALWPTPARWAVVFVQALCFLVIPVQGAHFLVDMIAGGAIGIVAIALSARIVAWPIGQTDSAASPRAVGWNGASEVAPGRALGFVSGVLPSDAPEVPSGL